MTEKCYSGLTLTRFRPRTTPAEDARARPRHYSLTTRGKFRVSRTGQTERERETAAPQHRIGTPFILSLFIFAALRGSFGGTPPHCDARTTRLSDRCAPGERGATTDCSLWYRARARMRSSCAPSRARGAPTNTLLSVAKNEQVGARGV